MADRSKIGGTLSRGQGRRISIGFQGGQVLALRVNDEELKGLYKALQGRRLARARERGRARTGVSRAGRLRARGG